MNRFVCAGVLLAVAVFVTGCASSSAPASALTRVTSHAGSPVVATAAPGDRTGLYLASQDGRVLVLRHGRLRTFLDIRSRVLAGGEQGLLGLVFAPDYARSGRFYVYYTAKDGRQNIVSFQRQGSHAGRTGQLVLRMADPEANHNGGDMHFGSDGYLYIGTGDGGGGNDQHGVYGNAQNLGSLLGKILRISPSRHGHGYTIPSSNPFVEVAGARGEIYAYGLRNPWRFSIDNQQLYIGDVGQDEVEEIDVLSLAQARGANFGWRIWEGDRRTDNSGGLRGSGELIAPVLTYTHPDSCSIVGGVVSHDPKSRWNGKYLFSDFCNGVIRAYAGPGRTPATVATVSQPTAFGVGPGRHVYVTSLNGSVFRIN